MTAIVCTAVVGFVFIRMSYAYTVKRANQGYANGKPSAPSIRSFRTLSKVLFVTSMLMTLASYWVESRYLLPFVNESSILRLAGASLVLVGYLNLDRTFRTLGENYSPLFDAFLPKNLITGGIYRFIRHPVYLFNLFVSFGLAVSSGSLLVLLNASIGLAFLLRTIALEEAYLSEHFSNYSEYMKTSWRLLPYLY